MWLKNSVKAMAHGKDVDDDAHGKEKCVLLRVRTMHFEHDLFSGGTERRSRPMEKTKTFVR